MKLGDATAIKVGSANVSRVYVGSNLVWPVGFEYHIVSNTITIHYSSGSMINAAGSNYAYITATVRRQRGQVVIDTIENAVLTPSISSSSDFYISGTEIHGNNRGTIPGNQLSVSVSVSYGGSTPVSGGTVVQQRNEETAGTPIVVRNYGTPTTSTSTSNYAVSIGASAWTTTGAPAFASGGTTSLWTSATHDLTTITSTPWTDVTTPVYEYTSGATRQGTPYVSDSGTETTSTTESVTDTATITGSATGFSRSGLTVTAANRGTVVGAMRSVTYTATNGNATPATVTLYQEANEVVSTTVVPNLSLHVDHTGNYPYLGGIFDVYYVSEAATTTEYTSGATSSETTALTTEVDTMNCTADVSTVSGSGTFTITVGQSGSSQRWVFLEISDPVSGQSASDDRRQDATPATVRTARVYPDVDANGGVRLRLRMTQGTFPASPVVVSGLVYHYILDGTSTEQTRTVSGDITVTADGDAIALRTITWFSGYSGTHWFSASGVSEIGIANTSFTHESFAVL